MPNKPKIVKEIVDEGYLTASLYSNGVIEIVWEPSIEIIDVIHLSKMQEAVCYLGEGKKMPLFFSFHDFLRLSKEGEKYATSDEGVKYSLAIAVLLDNIAKKLVMNFFLKMNKPKVPTKGFSTKEDAFVWLKKSRKGTI
jgi:hypothetical protein